MAHRCSRKPAGRKNTNLDQYFEMVYESDEETAKKLIKPSANIRNSNERTLIDRAMEEYNLEKLQQFIRLGCDVNSRTKGQTPLFNAIKLCKFDVARILLEANADVNIKSTCITRGEIEDSAPDPDSSAARYSLSPIYLAVRDNHLEMVDLLIKHGAKTDEPSLLHAAIRTGSSELLRKLLKAGAFVDQEDHKKWTPLATAIIFKETTTVKLLLEHGADVRKVIPFLVFQNDNQIFFSPLLLTTMFDVNLIPLLLASGADPCVGRIPHGTSQRMDLKWCMAPLCSSLGRGSESLQYFLLVNCPLLWTPGDHAPAEHNDPDNMFHQHDSALYVALFKKGKACVELLLHAGFDVSSCGAPTRQLASRIVEDNKNKDLASLLRIYMAKPLSLLSLCRNTIRASLGYGIAQKVTQLNLPRPLIHYVLLKDIITV